MMVAIKSTITVVVTSGKRPVVKVKYKASKHIKVNLKKKQRFKTPILFPYNETFAYNFITY